MTQMQPQRSESERHPPLSQSPQRFSPLRPLQTMEFPMTPRSLRLQGQSTLEYILALAAILVLIIAGTLTALQPGINAMMNDSSSTIQAATTRVQTELGLLPPTSGTTPTSPPGSGTPGSGQPPGSTNPGNEQCSNGRPPPCVNEGGNL